MTTAPSLAPSIIVPRPRGAYDITVQDEIDLCYAQRAFELDNAVHGDVAAYLEDEFSTTIEFDMPEPAPSRFADYVDKVGRGIRLTRCRLIARTKSRASAAEKTAPPKTIEVTKGINTQIWVTKQLSCSIDWNRVAFDKKTFDQFQRLVRDMPSRRRRWFRQRFCFAGVAA